MTDTSSTFRVSSGLYFRNIPRSRASSAFRFQTATVWMGRKAFVNLRSALNLNPYRVQQLVLDRVTLLDHLPLAVGP